MQTTQGLPRRLPLGAGCCDKPRGSRRELSRQAACPEGGQAHPLRKSGKSVGDQAEAACSHWAGPCAQALYCPTTRRARHPHATLQAAQLRHRGREASDWPHTAQQSGGAVTVAQDIPSHSPQGTTALGGLSGLRSSRGHNGFHKEVA